MLNYTLNHFTLPFNHAFNLDLRLSHKASSSTLPPEIIQQTFLLTNLSLFFMTAATTVADEG